MSNSVLYIEFNILPDGFILTIPLILPYRIQSNSPVQNDRLFVGDLAQFDKSYTTKIVDCLFILEFCSLARVWQIHLLQIQSNHVQSIFYNMTS